LNKSSVSSNRFDFCFLVTGGFLDVFEDTNNEFSPISSLKSNNEDEIGSDSFFLNTSDFFGLLDIDKRSSPISSNKDPLLVSFGNSFGFSDSLIFVGLDGIVNNSSSSPNNDAALACNALSVLLFLSSSSFSFVFEESSPNNDVDEDGSSLNKLDSIFSGSPNNEVDSSFSIFTFTVGFVSSFVDDSPNNDEDGFGSSFNGFDSSFTESPKRDEDSSDSPNNDEDGLDSDSFGFSSSTGLVIDIGFSSFALVVEDDEPNKSSSSSSAPKRLFSTSGNFSSLGGGLGVVFFGCGVLNDCGFESGVGKGLSSESLFAAGEGNGLSSNGPF